MPKSKKDSSTNEKTADAYFQVWKIEQDHSRTRWTVTTFFLSISFAILGLSFKEQAQTITLFGFTLPDLQRFVGLIIFWFSYFLFLQFDRYTYFLREQLRNMEKDKLVTFRFQKDADEFMYSGVKEKSSSKRLLRYFGYMYTILVLVIRFFAK
jgi:hypothetical protein